MGSSIAPKRGRLPRGRKRRSPAWRSGNENWQRRASSPKSSSPWQTLAAVIDRYRTGSMKQTGRTKARVLRSIRPMTSPTSTAASSAALTSWRSRQNWPRVAGRKPPATISPTSLRSSPTRGRLRARPASASATCDRPRRTLRDPSVFSHARGGSILAARRQAAVRRRASVSIW